MSRYKDSLIDNTTINSIKIKQYKTQAINISECKMSSIDQIKDMVTMIKFKTTHTLLMVLIN